MMAFIPMNFPSVISLDSYGLKNGIVVGQALTVLGLGIRCLLNFNFAFAIVG